MSQNKTKFNPKGFLKILSIIHFAIVAGPILFLTVTYTSIVADSQVLEISESMFFYLIPALAVASIVLGNRLALNQIAEARTKNSLQSKLVAYQTASIIRYALIEGVTLLSIVTFSNEFNLYYLILALLLLGYLILIRPTKNKIFTDLKLSAQEIRQFDE